MKINKVLKYTLSEEEKTVLDQAAEILRELRDTECIEYSTEFDRMLRDDDLETTIDTIDSIIFYSGVELTMQN
jgi:hypothetical protein